MPFSLHEWIEREIEILRRWGLWFELKTEKGFERERERDAIKLFYGSYLWQKWCNWTSKFNILSIHSFQIPCKGWSEFVQGSSNKILLYFSTYKPPETVTTSIYCIYFKVFKFSFIELVQCPFSLQHVSKIHHMQLFFYCQLLLSSWVSSPLNLWC